MHVHKQISYLSLSLSQYIYIYIYIYIHRYTHTYTIYIYIYIYIYVYLDAETAEPSDVEDGAVVRGGLPVSLKKHSSEQEGH